MDGISRIQINHQMWCSRIITKAVTDLCKIIKDEKKKQPKNPDGEFVDTIHKIWAWVHVFMNCMNFILKFSSYRMSFLLAKTNFWKWFKEWFKTRNSELTLLSLNSIEFLRRRYWIIFKVDKSRWKPFFFLLKILYWKNICLLYCHLVLNCN